MLTLGELPSKCPAYKCSSQRLLPGELNLKQLVLEWSEKATLKWDFEAGSPDGWLARTTYHPWPVYRYSSFACDGSTVVKTVISFELK